MNTSSLRYAAASLMVAVSLSSASGQGTAEKKEVVAKPLAPPKEGWKRLSEKDSPHRLWVNVKEKQLAVDGEVCLTRGYLEMFACSANTKEHESVVALKALPQLIHVGLLAIGAEHGTPSNWRPYRPATGDVIKIFVEWMDGDKLKRVPAQQWVRDLKTKKAMVHDWVFAGSGWVTDPDTKKRYYRADGGEVVCVSNFPVSMLDLPIKSSQVNDELAFEALTENIPKRRTPVRVYFVPEKKKANKETEAKKTKPSE